MSNLIRFGISAEEELIKCFDELSARRGYGNRSEALCDLMRDAHVHLILAILLSICPLTAAQAQAQRTLSGTVITGRNEAVAGATITVRSSAGELTATSDSEGNFKLAVPAEALIVKVTGKNLVALERKIDARELTGHVRFEISYLNPPKNTPSRAAGLDGDEFGIVGVALAINLCYSWHSSLKLELRRSGRKSAG